MEIQNISDYETWLKTCESCLTQQDDKILYERRLKGLIKKPLAVLCSFDTAVHSMLDVFQDDKVDLLLLKYFLVTDKKQRVYKSLQYYPHNVVVAKGYDERFQLRRSFAFVNILDEKSENNNININTLIHEVEKIPPILLYQVYKPILVLGLNDQFLYKKRMIYFDATHMLTLPSKELH
ncbi:MAG: hypothetical protein ABIF40_03625 [archaeon]